MRKSIAFTVFWLSLLLCSSRGTDLFHITADEQLAKFQDLFRSLASEDTESLSKTIACFVLGNDPDGTDQAVLYDHDSFIDSLTTPSSNYDHISVTVDEESLTIGGDLLALRGSDTDEGFGDGRCDGDCVLGIEPIVRVGYTVSVASFVDHALTANLEQGDARRRVEIAVAPA